MENSEDKIVYDVDSDSEDEEYGDCVGPNSMYVKLVSNDGHEFIIKRKHVLISPTLEIMLSGPGMFTENQTNKVVFKDIPSNILRTICLYLTYIAQQENNFGKIPPFPVSKDTAFEVLMAANFLDL